MKELLKAQEMARRNNENFVVFAAYERRRKRRLAGLATRKRKMGDPKCGLTLKQLDDLVWLAAEREARPVRVVGFFLP